jgi:hypothetical protein
MMETKGGNLPDHGFVAQIVFSIINENFAHYSQQPQQATIGEKLFQETLATMSWSGRLTTAFDRESRTLLIVNFLPNDAAEGLRIANMYESHGDEDQKAHAKWFFYYYGEQQRTLAAQQQDGDSIEETIHERNFRVRQQEYERDVFQTSSFNAPSVQMRHRLHRITRPCSSEPPGADHSQVASTSTSSSTEPIRPRFLIQTPQDEGTRPGATSERNRTDLPMAQQQAERQVPDLQSKEFRGWREEALRDHRNTPDQQSMRLRIDSLRLSEITEEEEPGAGREEEPGAVARPSLEQHQPSSSTQPESTIDEEPLQEESSEELYKRMCADLGIKAGKVQKDQAVGNIETLTFLNDWW